jgi:hypothetical protein
MHKVNQCFAIMLLATAALGGCATQSSTETVRKETVQYPAEQAQHQRDPVVVEKQTTEKSETTKTEEDSGGVLSSSVNIVGDVLALPFRAVAGLFEVLF